jgi:hypothetical protein
MSAPTTQDMSEAMNNEQCKTPVEDLLKAIPQDLVIQFATDHDGFKVWHNCPIGREAHEAVALIASLRADLARATEAGIECVEKLEFLATHLRGRMAEGALADIAQTAADAREVLEQ